MHAAQTLQPITLQTLTYILNDCALTLNENQIHTMFNALPKPKRNAYSLREVIAMGGHHLTTVMGADDSVHNIKAALALCLTFLKINKINVHVNELELYQIVMEFFYEEISEEELINFLMDHAGEA